MLIQVFRHKITGTLDASLVDQINSIRDFRTYLIQARKVEVRVGCSQETITTNANAIAEILKEMKITHEIT
jgi:hypothetical protein